MNSSTVSIQTRNHWLVDAGLLVSAVLASLTGIYFLFLPRGGYAGGRNPFYGVVVLFERHTWEDLHTWTGIAMVLIAAVHFARHWTWVVSMARRVVKEITGQCDCMNRRGRWNLILNAIVAISGLLTALSGIYFFLLPGGRGAADPDILFSRFTWDMIHTWAGIVLVASAVLHFSIHWRWVTKVTSSLLLKKAVFPSSAAADAQVG